MVKDSSLLIAYMLKHVSLTTKEQNRIEEIFKARLFEAGDYLVRLGEVCRYITFIQSGLMRYFFLKNGEEIIGNFFFDNTFVGAFQSFITQTPSTLYVDCIESCQTLQATFDDWEALYIEIPKLERFGRKMAEQLFIFSQQRTASLLFETPDERYKALVKRRPKVIQRVPQYMIASYLGVTPETVSRIRKRLTLKK
jgi:CRP/FNR family transcriptional regulator, anaerobic regulatory protein